MILKLVLILLSLSSICSEAQETQSLKTLKRVLKKYKNQNVFMKIEKNLHIPIINKIKKEKGSFYLSKNKFRLQTQSSPSSLIVFDGTHLWYQSDLEEKIVLKSEATHSYFYLFSHIFSVDHFFQTFKIIQSEQKNSIFIYHLKPLKKMDGIQKIVLTVGNHIQRLDINWEDLNNSQSYRFYKPWFKKHLSSSLFVFKNKEFKIINKN